MTILRFFTIGLFILYNSACGEKKQEKSVKVESDSHQESLVTETSSEVPELWDFHDVIYQIWHEAWPEKNTEMLKELIPEIEVGFAKLEIVSLPGILRDKQDDWLKGIRDMAEIIKTYKSAAASNQKESLLNAAEDLHTQFEMLVRLVRPVMKEIDQFHQELYMLYHYYMPDYDLQKINASTAELLSRVEPVLKAKLPVRLTDKQQVFDQANIDLKESLIQLQKFIEEKAEKGQVLKAIELVHDKYQLMVGIFE